MKTLRDLDIDSKDRVSVIKKVQDIKNQFEKKVVAHPLKIATMELLTWKDLAIVAAKHDSAKEGYHGAAMWLVIVAILAYFFPLVAVAVALVVAVWCMYSAKKSFIASVATMEMADDTARNVSEYLSFLHIDPHQEYEATVFGPTEYDEAAWPMGSTYEIEQLYVAADELYQLKKSY